MFHSIYKDFIRFLDALETERAWEAYKRYYYHPHKEFLESYWSTFRWMDLPQIQNRVENVKRGDYSTLMSLLHEVDLESMAGEVLEKCVSTFELSAEPDVYFMVGFFSADGYVLELNGKPVIGFGLERFQSWRLFPILFAHEYAHYLRHLYRHDEPYVSASVSPTSRFLLSEGVATLFSEIVFPEYPLREHLFLSEERLRWCRKNWEYVWNLIGPAIKEERDFELFWRGDSNLEIPPRIGHYIGYSLAKEYITRHPESGFRSLLQLKDITEVMRDRNQE